MSDKVIGVIPARMHSTRLPRKMLRMIGDKPLIQHVWERCSHVHSVDRLIIATDHSDIVDVVDQFGGEAIMTAPTHISGTDRIAEVAAAIECEIVLNIQGDEPFISEMAVDALVRAFDDDPPIDVATLCFRETDMSLISDPNLVKVVCDNNGFALYFSRAQIPYDREATQGNDFLKHIGIYAFRKDYLLRFTSLERSALEEREKLEQLRILSNGGRIKVIETSFDSCGVDTEEDLKQACERYNKI